MYFMKGLTTKIPTCTDTIFIKNKSKMSQFKKKIQSFVIFISVFRNQKMQKEREKTRQVSIRCTDL